MPAPFPHFIKIIFVHFFSSSCCLECFKLSSAFISSFEITSESPCTRWVNHMKTHNTIGTHREKNSIPKKYLLPVIPQITVPTIRPAINKMDNHAIIFLSFFIIIYTKPFSLFLPHTIPAVFLLLFPHIHFLLDDKNKFPLFHLADTAVLQNDRDNHADKDTRHVLMP